MFLVWAGYAMGLWGYTMAKGYDVGLKELIVPSEWPGWSNIASTKSSGSGGSGSSKSSSIPADVGKSVTKTLSKAPSTRALPGGPPAPGTMTLHCKLCKVAGWLPNCSKAKCPENY